MKEETKLWIEKASEDLIAVKILLQSNDFPASVVCFHCQQTVEKLLKAFLVDHEIEFPRTHDLILLVEKFILPLDADFTEILSAVNDLNDFSVITRYPDISEEIDVQSAYDAYNAVSFIESFILPKIKKD